jgi:hypothetical protein
VLPAFPESGTTDIEGPFYIVDARKSCAPIANAELPASMARAAMIPDGSKNPPSGKPAMAAMKHTKGLVTGTLNVIVNG